MSKVWVGLCLSDFSIHFYCFLSISILGFSTGTSRRFNDTEVGKISYVFDLRAMKDFQKIKSSFGQFSSVQINTAAMYLNPIKIAHYKEIKRNTKNLINNC